MSYPKHVKITRNKINEKALVELGAAFDRERLNVTRAQINQTRIDTKNAQPRGATIDEVKSLTVKELSQKLNISIAESETIKSQIEKLYALSDPASEHAVAPAIDTSIRPGSIL